MNSGFSAMGRQLLLPYHYGRAPLARTQRLRAAPVRHNNPLHKGYRNGLPLVQTSRLYGILPQDTCFGATSVHFEGVIAPCVSA
jgi:hypothetical protein